MDVPFSKWHPKFYAISKYTKKNHKGFLFLCAFNIPNCHLGLMEDRPYGWLGKYDFHLYKRFFMEKMAQIPQISKGKKKSKLQNFYDKFQ